MPFKIVKLTETDFEIIATCEAYDERPIREKLEDTEYEVSKNGKVVSNFSKPRLITSMEKDANPTFMKRFAGNGGVRFTPVSQLAVKLMYKIGDKTKGKGHGGEKSCLTAEEAFRNKVVVVDTDYMIVPNPY
jgi:hypothetical protein